MNKKKIAIATALAALALWTLIPSKVTRSNRVLANAFPAALLASPKTCTTPEWPAEARRYEVEGITLVHFHISQLGQVEDASVVKSSGWGMLDAAALESLIQCKFKPGLDEAERNVTFPIQFVWTLAGPSSIRPQLVAGSCAASEAFVGFEGMNRAPTATDGVLVRFLVDGTGKAVGVKAETGDAGLARAAAQFVGSCRFAVDPSLPGEKTDTLFGRVTRKQP